jgi:hypothetical protein
MFQQKADGKLSIFSNIAILSNNYFKKTVIK